MTSAERTPACRDCVADGRARDAVNACAFVLPPYPAKKIRPQLCSRPICRAHSVTTAPGVHYCPQHAPKTKPTPEPPASGELF